MDKDMHRERTWPAWVTRTAAEARRALIRLAGWPGIVATRLARLARVASSYQPPGPFRQDFWRSPLRGRWMTSVFGLVLLVGLPVVAITGLVSYASYNPRLPGNDETP